MKNKKLLPLITAVIAMFGVSLLFTNSAQALSGSQFNAGRIIDDQAFFNGSAVSVSDIQSFLNAKLPSCDTNGSLSKSYSYNGQWVTTSRAVYVQRFGYPGPPYACLKDVQHDSIAKSPDAYCSGPLYAGRKSSAQIIYEVGVACNVSQKALLVLLQKEQSLVTDDWPWPDQYRSATGYGCPDTAPCDAEYYGFFNQVYNAARQFQRYTKQSSLFNYRSGRDNYIQYNPNGGCGGSNVFLQNSASAALYNYTPYQPNSAALNNLYGTGDGCSAYGNRNFWRLFNDWFGSTTTDLPPLANTLHPDGTLVRAYNENAVYLIKNGKKYLVPDLFTFQVHNFRWENVRYATDPDRALPVESSWLFYADRTLVRGSGNNQIYYITCDITTCTKQLITGIDVFNSLGFTPGEVKEMHMSLILAMVTGDPLSSTTLHPARSLVIDRSNNKVYYIDSGQKRWIPSSDIFGSNNFGWHQVKTATPQDLLLADGTNVGFGEGAVIRANNSPSIYVVNNVDGTGTQEKRHITNTRVYFGLGYNSSNTSVIDLAFLPAQTGTALTEN